MWSHPWTVEALALRDSAPVPGGDVPGSETHFEGRVSGFLAPSL